MDAAPVITSILPSPQSVIGAQRVPSNPLNELVEEAGIVAGVIDDICAESREVTAIRHRRLSNEVSMPDKDRIQTESVGDHVDEPLANETRLEPSRRPIRTAWRLVRKPHMTD